MYNYILPIEQQAEFLAKPGMHVIDSVDGQEVENSHIEVLSEDETEWKGF